MQGCREVGGTLNPKSVETIYRRRLHRPRVCTLPRCPTAQLDRPYVRVVAQPATADEQPDSCPCLPHVHFTGHTCFVSRPPIADPLRPSPVPSAPIDRGTGGHGAVTWEGGAGGGWREPEWPVRRAGAGGGVASWGKRRPYVPPGVSALEARGVAVIVIAVLGRLRRVAFGVWRWRQLRCIH